MKSDEALVRELLQEALDAQRTPEEVCAAHPRLLAEVRRGWSRVRALESELTRAFPPGEYVASGLAEPLPSIPGYRLEGVLGRGGMGVVYRARHLGLQRDVALKMMLAGEYASPRELARFLQEARSVATLCHANIVQVFDVGEVDGRPYYTMELLEGGSLARKIASEPPSVAAAAALVRTLATAVEFAHRRGIVHRDLKPANILLTPDGTPRISDFGLARRIGDASLSASGAVVGTPSYMAPEQISPTYGSVGPAADVYALGAVLYELLTGRAPFRATSALATQVEVLEREPVSPARLDSRVPRDLETITLCCLRKQPARRYPNAAALAADLERFERGEPVAARRLGLLERISRRITRRPAQSMLALLLVLGGAYLAIEFANRVASAAERGRSSELWRPQVAHALELLRAGQYQDARRILEVAPDNLEGELLRTVADARRDLATLDRLDAIRMRRVVIAQGRVDEDGSRSDREYAAVFAGAGLGAPSEAPETVAARVRAAPVATELIGALDDWAACATDPARRAWITQVLSEADGAVNEHADELRALLRSPDAEKDAAAIATRLERIEPGTCSAQLLLAVADALRARGVDATRILRRLQLQNPEDFWVNLRLGQALSGANDADALRFLQSAVGVRPDSVVARVDLAGALRRAGRLDEALDQFRRANTLDPGFAYAHGEFAMALAESGDAARAMAELREALRLDPEADWLHNNLGNLLWNAGRHEEALAEYREAGRLNPQSVAAFYSLALHLQLLGRQEEALQAARRAVELDPVGAGPSALLADSLIALGSLAEAVEPLRTALRSAPDSGRERRLLTMLVQLGRQAEALELVRQRIERVPQVHDSWDGAVELCLYLGDAAAAQLYAAQMLQRFKDSDDPLVCERLGRSCLLLAESPLWTHGVALVERALDPQDCAPEWAKPFFQAARALSELRQGRDETALALARGPAAGALGPAPELVAALALARLGRLGAARTAYVDAVLGSEWSPRRADSREYWIYHLLRREAEAWLFPECARWLEGEGAPRDVEECVALAVAHRARGSDLSAARWMERAWSQAPDLFADLDHWQRYHAARMAGEAALGSSAEGAAASPAEREQLRHLTLRLLRAELEELAHSGGGPCGPAARLRFLREDLAFRWLQRLDTGSAEERDAWQRLWSDVERMIAACAG